MCERCGQPCERRYCDQRCRARANQARYRASAKGKAVQKRYQESRLGKAAQRRYQHSDKGRTAHERWLLKHGVRVGLRGRRRMTGSASIRERDWVLYKLRHDPAYRELIRQRVSDEAKRRYQRERFLKFPKAA